MKTLRNLAITAVMACSLTACGSTTDAIKDALNTDTPTNPNYTDPITTPNTTDPNYANTTGQIEITTLNNTNPFPLNTPIYSAYLNRTTTTTFTSDQVTNVVSFDNGQTSTTKTGTVTIEDPNWMKITDNADQSVSYFQIIAKEETYKYFVIAPHYDNKTTTADHYERWYYGGNTTAQEYAAATADASVFNDTWLSNRTSTLTMDNGTVVFNLSHDGTLTGTGPNHSALTGTWSVTNEGKLNILTASASGDFEFIITIVDNPDFSNINVTYDINEIINNQAVMDTQGRQGGLAITPSF